MFQTAIAPLKLEIRDTTVWSNPKPSTHHFFRPLHLQYQKETKEPKRAEELDVWEQIEILQDFEFEIPFSNQKAKVEIKIQMTMLDGKAVNAVTDTNSSQSCNACSAKPSEMNKLDTIREKVCN